jgi:hypothetical protein
MPGWRGSNSRGRDGARPRAPVVTWEENNCVEGNAYITINGQVYFVGGDGLLMPSKRGQAPPDLKHFRTTQK